MNNSSSLEKFFIIFTIVVVIIVGVAFAVLKLGKDDPVIKPTDTSNSDSATSDPITSAYHDSDTVDVGADTDASTTLPLVEETTATVPETTSPALIPTKVVSVVACGDNLLYRPNTWEADERSNGGKRDFSFTYANVADFVEKADIAFINQETLLCGGNSGYPLFNSPFEMADTLVDVGFDVFNMATNHMLDVGYDGGLFSTGEGILTAREYLDKLPITVVGGYKNLEDSETVRVVERDGIKVAFLAFTESTNTIRLAEGSSVVIPYLTEENVKKQVALAESVADVIIVSAHWGVDSSERVSDTQMKFAKLFADLGVDAVIGHHPHVLHPIEWIKGENGNEMLCAYSLGNFIGIMEEPETILGGFLSFDIVSENGNAPVIGNVGFVPTVYNYNSIYRNNVVYFLEDYTDELAASHGVATVYGNKFNVSDLTEYLNSTVSGQFIRSASDY